MIHCCRLERRNDSARRGTSRFIAKYVRIEIQDDDLNGKYLLRTLLQKVREDFPGFTLCHSFPTHGEH